jgi:hypothetical protein
MEKINPEEHAKKLTTLNRLMSTRACRTIYAHLVRELGGTTFDHDAPINLLTILETNGVVDCLWALRATVENCDTVARLMAADLAEDVLPYWSSSYPTDNRLHECIDAARLFALGKITCEKLSDAAYAAESATWEARTTSASAAAWAARSAGDAVVTRAANVAAWAARSAGASGISQAEIIKSYLLP